MSTDEPAGERSEPIEIVTGATTAGEFLRSQGTYRYERDGVTVHGDASGEWTLDENGEVEDIVSFVSPLFLMKLRKRGLVEDRPPRRSRRSPPPRIGIEGWGPVLGASCA